MIRIFTLKIQRYRSIMDITLDFDQEYNLVSICGTNNVGKTNSLRAVNLFFNPSEYQPKTDIPTLKNATAGGAVHPKIEIVFFDDKSSTYYDIARDFRPVTNLNHTTTGYSYKGSTKRKLERKDLSGTDLEAFFRRIVFIYIESINTIVPTLIDAINQDVLSLQYDKTRFTSNKRALKEAYDKYVDGLQEILDVFSNDVSETFKVFRDTWDVKFQVPKNSDSFRSLISDDVEFQIKDKGSSGVIDKGSGLQRLALILMQFEAADRMSSNKSIIMCIDEPDIYLHEGLQKKLKKFLDDKSKKMQIIYTTHSRIFIDTYKLKNTILLSSEFSSQFITRRNKTIDIAETIKIDIDSDQGYSDICEHLGIEKEKYELLQRHNILVEGGCDKKYLEEFAKYFSLDVPNIISVTGADNMQKYLEFYNSIYKDSNNYKPIVKVLLDNDAKGRDIFRKLISKYYENITVSTILLQNCMGTANCSDIKNNTNNEMEDFIYPEVLCLLINLLLKKRGMIEIDTKIICKKCTQKSFSSGGILNICEHAKNEVNPDDGDSITFISSGNETNKAKEGLAGLLCIEGNRKLIKMLAECDKKYPQFKKTLLSILTF